MAESSTFYNPYDSEDWDSDGEWDIRDCRNLSIDEAQGIALDLNKGKNIGANMTVVHRSYLAGEILSSTCLFQAVSRHQNHDGCGALVRRTLRRLDRISKGLFDPVNDFFIQENGDWAKVQQAMERLRKRASLSPNYEESSDSEDRTPVEPSNCNFVAQSLEYCHVPSTSGMSSDKDEDMSSVAQKKAVPLSKPHTSIADRPAENISSLKQAQKELQKRANETDKASKQETKARAKKRKTDASSDAPSAKVVCKFSYDPLAFHLYGDPPIQSHGFLSPASIKFLELHGCPVAQTTYAQLRSIDDVRKESEEEAVRQREWGDKKRLCEQMERQHLEAKKRKSATYHQNSSPLVKLTTFSPRAAPEKSRGVIWNESSPSAPQYTSPPSVQFKTPISPAEVVARQLRELPQIPEEPHFREMLKTLTADVLREAEKLIGRQMGRVDRIWWEILWRDFGLDYKRLKLPIRELYMAHVEMSAKQNAITQNDNHSLVFPPLLPNVVIPPPLPLPSCKKVTDDRLSLPVVWGTLRLR